MSIEPRWPVILVVVAVLTLMTLLPSRIRVFPPWVPFLLALALIVPMAALSLSTARTRWLRIESIVTLLFLAIIGFAIAFGLREMFSRMLHPSAELTGLQLLSSSVMAWVANVMLFSILYWRMDRGGPEARANHVCTRPDWQFPDQSRPKDGSPEWCPAFADYLFLAFCTATAFSPTGDLPLTSRAKLLMMVESMISLVTIIAVASRAINILGS
jgi:hypothetical protein